MSVSLSYACILLPDIFKIDIVQYKLADLSRNFLSKTWVLLLAKKKLLVYLRPLYRVKGIGFCVAVSESSSFMGLLLKNTVKPLIVNF